MPKWNVYISSTFIDLREFRAALIGLFENQLKNNFELSRIMERMFDDGTYTPFVKDCIEAVAGCDIYVIILGNRAGSFLPGEDRTYTEVELATAIAHEKRIFCLRLEAFDETKIDYKAKHSELLNRFEGRFTHTFNTTAELEKALYECLFPFASQSPVNTKNPYKGLEAFGVEDGGYFFGREAETEACLKKIVTAKGNSFMAVIGDSGTGKSSFVQAGLLFRLKYEAALGFSNSPQIIVRPGSEPFTNLQYQLQLQGLSVETVLSGYLRSPGFILFFDQFEEVITQCHTPQAKAERTQLFSFLDALTTNQNKGSIVLVICAFRSDFLSQLANYDYIKSRQYLFPLSSLDYKVHAANWEQSIREIITQPALKNGIAIEKELTDQLINQLKEVEGALPILQFALQQLWNHETIKNRRIDATEYSRLSGGKGMAGIIEAHAERVVENITHNGKDKEREAVLKSIFVNLVEVNANLRDVKRTVPKNELFQILNVYPEHSVNKVFETLVSEKSRLLQIGKEESDAATVSVIHEALIRKWERLRGWINKRRETLEHKKRILYDIAAYHKGEERLYRGKKLKKARQWKAKNPDLSNSDINVFLLRAQKSRERRRYGVAGAVVAGIVMLLLAKFIVIPYYEEKQFLDEKKQFLVEVENYETVKNQIIESGGDINSITALTMDEINCVFLSKNMRFFPKLKHLNIKDIKKINLFFLQQVDRSAGIISLNIEDNEGLSNLEGIENLKDIKFLTIMMTDIQRLNEIEKLTNLKSLSIIRNHKLLKLDGINLTNLNTLIIEDNPKPVFNFISKKITIPLHIVVTKDKGMYNLHSLIIENNNNIGSIYLKGMYNLHSLIIKNNNNIRSIYLEGMDNLHSLAIYGNNNLTSLKGIDKLTNLNSLTISYNYELTDLKGIESLINLKSLSIEGNSQLTSIKGIETLKTLHYLTIGRNHPDLDPDPLYTLTRLKELRLPYQHNMKIDIKRIQRNNPGVKIVIE